MKQELLMPHLNRFHFTSIRGKWFSFFIWKSFFGGVLRELVRTYVINHWKNAPSRVSSRYQTEYYQNIIKRYEVEWDHWHPDRKNILDGIPKYRKHPDSHYLHIYMSNNGFALKINSDSVDKVGKAIYYNVDMGVFVKTDGLGGREIPSNQQLESRIINYDKLRNRD